MLPGGLSRADQSSAQGGALAANPRAGRKSAASQTRADGRAAAVADTWFSAAV
jgi:hypothetical protein